MGLLAPLASRLECSDTDSPLLDDARLAEMVRDQFTISFFVPASMGWYVAPKQCSTNAQNF
jgi:hypothetical protein